VSGNEKAAILACAGRVDMSQAVDFKWFLKVGTAYAYIFGITKIKTLNPHNKNKT